MNAVRNCVMIIALAFHFLYHKKDCILNNWVFISSKFLCVIGLALEFDYHPCY